MRIVRAENFCQCIPNKFWSGSVVVSASVDDRLGLGGAVLEIRVTLLLHSSPRRVMPSNIPNIVSFTRTSWRRVVELVTGGISVQYNNI